MKTRLLILLFFTAISLINAQSKTLIPDENFEKYLIRKGIDTDDIVNGEVLTRDIIGVEFLSFSANDGVRDLTGIQDFAALKEFSAGFVFLENLSFSQNSNLEKLILTDTQTKTLNISSNTKLIELAIYDYFETLISLNISNNINLTSLTLIDSQLTTLDISKNVNLTELDLNKNQFTALDVSKNTKLTEIYVNENNLTSLDVGNLSDLEILYFNKNNISEIDLSNNIKLKRFYATENKIQSLNLVTNTNLEVLGCENNELTALNIQNGNNTKIRIFYVEMNPNLACILVDDKDYSDKDSAWKKDTTSRFSENCNEQTAVPDANFELYLESRGFGNEENNDGSVDTNKISTLTTLDISDENITDLTGIQDFLALKNLNASVNSLVAIDVSKNVNLESLNLGQNLITDLDVTKNTKLTTLIVQRNRLTNLDLSKNLAINELNFSSNNLTEIDLTKLVNLGRLDCFSNKLTALNITKNTEIFNLNVNDNQLEYLDVYTNPALRRIDVSYNKLKYIDFQKNIIVELDASNNELIGLNLKNNNNNVLFNFDIRNNVNLTCVEVDNVNFSTNNWPNKDSQTVFSLDCAPVNDDCANAIPLTFGQPTPGDINSGNTNNNAPCVTSTVIADVWFSIIVPQTGEISVEGAAFGGQLKFAVYETCASATPLACGTNISLKNLTIGAQLNLKVWLEDSVAAKSASENGTFTITASDSSVLSVDNFLEKNIQLIMYPNPAKSNISITISNNSTIQKVEVYSILGDKIITQNGLHKLKANIDVSNISTGIYFVKVKTANGILSKKLIIN